MAFFNLLWYIIAVAVMNIFEQVLNAADWIMFTIEDYEIYDNLVKFLSSCVSNYYFWQALATIGFWLYLRRLADRFPPPTVPINVGLVDVGPSTEQLLEEKEKSLKVAASMNDDLGKENAGLRTKVDYLQKELDFIAKDRYALVHEKFILQNKLGDFNSWPEFRVEYDELATQYEVMKRQRAREHISQEQIMYIAQEAKLELAAVKRAEAMSKIAHSEELKVVKQERDEAREKYQTLLTTTTTTTAIATTAIATPAIATTAIATPTAAGQDTPGDKVLQEENTRLTLALRSKTSLLSKRTSDLERMQSLVKTRSDHSASQLQSAASKILTLKEEKAKSEERIAELERDVRVANEKAEEMEDMYMAVAFADEGEDEEEEDEKEEERSGEDSPETSWLMKQVVAMSKKGRNGAGSGATVGGSGADEDESEGEDEDDEEDGDNENKGDEEDKEEDEEEEQKQKIHDENEDLFKDMMGLP